MARRRTRAKGHRSSRRYDYLVVILGLTRDMLKWTKRILSRDTSQKPARYVGTPSPKNDWHNLYNKKNIGDAVRLIDREIRSRDTHRIIVLYIPSHDDHRLLTALHLACFLAPIKPDSRTLPYSVNDISWRHNKLMIKETVTHTLQQATTATDLLKAEITDNRISPLTLPAHNFHHPNRNSTISGAYREFAENMLEPPILKDELIPSRFTRDQLPNKAFKGKQHTDRFFQDSRGRVFPPDPYHAESRTTDREPIGTALPLYVLQKYRFGVKVRDGKVHYDVQYELPRKLRNEYMYCAVDGHVCVTGTHANVGVNDVIWVPGGTKQYR